MWAYKYNITTHDEYIMKNALVHDIFKVPVYEIDLDIDNQKLYNYCNEYIKTEQGRIISNQGGYQSEDLDLNESALQPLIEQIKLNSNTFADQVMNSCEQKIDNIWFNINRYKDSNTMHQHPDCEISGAYYVKAPEYCGRIVFEHPVADLLEYWDFKRKLKSDRTPYDAVTWNMPVYQNRLYLFPSWLKHRVDSNYNLTEDRVSFGFNTHYKGE